MELTDAHLRRLQGLLSQGFTSIRFPLFPAYVGIEKYGCAALLRPLENGRFEQAAQAGYLIKGNIAVLVERGGEARFVWKSDEVRATEKRREALRRFETELKRELETPPVV